MGWNAQTYLVVFEVGTAVQVKHRPDIKTGENSTKREKEIGSLGRVSSLFPLQAVTGNFGSRDYTSLTGDRSLRRGTSEKGGKLRESPGVSFIGRKKEGPRGREGPPV